MAVSPARRAAYELLLRVFEQDAYADRVFRTAARGLDERDRAFAQRLAYGAVQRVRTLDHAIGTLGKRPVRKLDPPVRAALRLGAYQLGYTDTAPHAAANESVELVRRARLERAVPFTNAVMRRLAAGIGDLLRALPDGALKESYPDWIPATWARDLGTEASLSLMRAQNEPPALEVHAAEPVGEPTDVPGAYVVDRVDPERMRPMSRASQLAALVVGSREGERILDACAAPGGKTSLLRGEVTAVEVHPGRAAALARAAGPNVRVVNADARELDDGGFDLKEHWGWNWSDTRKVLDYLFLVGELAIAGRNGSFEVRYDLPERVLPPEVLAAPALTEDEAVLELVAEFGGSISAEHGIGAMKVASLPRYKSHEELDAMRAMKAAFDPKNILNPGKTVPPVLRL